ncbi:MetQ/NlpA family ABC transporter substrate-binding protein [Candidatus Pantoea multigeneris]|nr:MetQ/NlpA family ABC transporter substrate-binding protein [Pantoea multigeneris]
MKQMLFRTGLLVLLTTAAIASQANDNATKTLRIGFNPGPYKEQFEQGVAPELIKQGYKIEYKDFSDGIQVNDAVDKGGIEANIMQHPVYLASVNDRLGIHNIGIVQVPTPPMGIYSNSQQQVTQPKEGAVVSVPNQPSNEYRAALLLQDLGWLKVDPKSDAATFSQRNITANPYHIVLKEMDNAQQVRALPDTDFGVIQGNFAVSSGLKLASALKLENPRSQFINVVTIAEKNKDSQWAKDIVAGYHSAAFKHYILSHHQYDGYLLPDYLK